MIFRTFSKLTKFPPLIHMMISMLLLLTAWESIQYIGKWQNRQNLCTKLWKLSLRPGSAEELWIPANVQLLPDEAVRARNHDEAAEEGPHRAAHQPGLWHRRGSPPGMDVSNGLIHLKHGRHFNLQMGTIWGSQYSCKTEESVEWLALPVNFWFTHPYIRLLAPKQKVTFVKLRCPPSFLNEESPPSKLEHLWSED